MKRVVKDSWDMNRVLEEFGFPFVPGLSDEMIPWILADLSARGLLEYKGEGGEYVVERREKNEDQVR